MEKITNISPKSMQFLNVEKHSNAIMYVFEMK